MEIFSNYQIVTFQILLYNIIFLLLQALFVAGSSDRVKKCVCCLHVYNIVRQKRMLMNIKLSSFIMIIITALILTLSHFGKDSINT